ncbi:hypothetical protein [Bradyrhizobium sp. USDA 4452]
MKRLFSLFDGRDALFWGGLVLLGTGVGLHDVSTALIVDGAIVVYVAIFGTK